jgi:hypothetical protein
MDGFRCLTYDHAVALTIPSASAYGTAMAIL